VCDVTLRTVKPGRPWCPWGRVLRALRSDHFPIILTYDPHPPSIATTKPETEKQGEQKGIGICKEVGVFIGYYAKVRAY
jgi:hypothetical protein